MEFLLRLSNQRVISSLLKCQAGIQRTRRLKLTEAPQGISCPAQTLWKGMEGEVRSAPPEFSLGKSY